MFDQENAIAILIIRPTPLTKVDELFSIETLILSLPNQSIKMRNLSIVADQFEQSCAERRNFFFGKISESKRPKSDGKTERINKPFPWGIKHVKEITTIGFP